MRSHDVGFDVSDEGAVGEGVDNRDENDRGDESVDDFGDRGSEANRLDDFEAIEDLPDGQASDIKKIQL